MPRRYNLVAAALLSAAWGAVAAPAQPPLDVSADPARVSAQIEQIRRELADGKTYVEIGSEQKLAVQAALDRLSHAFDRSGGSQLSASEQVSALSDQRAVNEILTKARDDSRLICRRQAKVGSNMLTSQCMTVAQRRRAEEAGKKGLDDLRSRTYSKEL